MATLYLDPRLIAIQGAGFPLSPISLAVQGLILQIQEEQRQNIGGGKVRKAVSTTAKAPAPESEQDIIRRVQEKWDTIERARAEDQARNLLAQKDSNLNKQEDDSAESTSASGAKDGMVRNVASQKPAEPFEPVQLDRSLDAAREQTRKRGANEAALLLILAEL